VIGQNGTIVIAGGIGANDSYYLPAAGTGRGRLRREVNLIATLDDEIILVV
jgi:hypothetical protein